MENNNEGGVYQPELGANNRYENARSSNMALAEQINKEALGIAVNAQSVLDTVKKDPSMKESHDEKTGAMHMGQWLLDQKKYITEQLYGVVQLDGLSGVPPEVENFVTEVYRAVEAR